ncbi:hypothetical protein EST38_g13621 [Candolleomyces aberdarensis]|uniref:Uncharacterized protein n=1 Tax=Candolleomyces aberdarensis TaxID=2316362 RepID=A0A4Q2CZH1_9AGAR|nr:hypothetical protein EST38_g13621 [Candolleomyces aberdarensis]
MPASAAVLGADSSTSQQATPAPIVEQLNSIASSLQALAAVSLQSTISNEELSSVATLLQALAAGSSALQQANSAPIDGHPKSAAVSLQAPAAASSTLQKVAVSTPVNEQLNSAVPALAAAPEIGSSVAQPVTSTTLVDEQLNRISGVRVITPQNATSSMPPLAGNGSLYLTNPIKNGHAPELEASPAPASNKSEKGKLSKWTMKHVKDRLLKPKDKPSHTGKGHVLTSDGSPPPYSSIP